MRAALSPHLVGNRIDTTGQRTHAPRRVSANGRGVWTLTEASVEYRVMSVATAAGADETSDAEKRESAAWREPRSALSEIGLRHHAGVLARIRLTRTAAERGPVLSGACRPGELVPTPGIQVPSVCEPPE